jgi:predicted cytidylate kinase
MRITISGTPGSGKSTMGAMLSKRLDWPYINGGSIFRELAAEHNMSLVEFRMYAETHPEIDTELDQRLIAAARAHDDAIIEGRLTGWMTEREGIPALRIWMTASEDTRVLRLVERDGGTQKDALEKHRERMAADVAQYRRVYGLDLDDLSPYDLIIETDDRTPENIAEEILQAIDRAQLQE